MVDIHVQVEMYGGGGYIIFIFDRLGRIIHDLKRNTNNHAKI